MNIFILGLDWHDMDDAVRFCKSNKITILEKDNIGLLMIQTTSAKYVKLLKHLGR